MRGRNKYLLIFLINFLVVIGGYTQVVAIENIYQNIAYPLVSAPLTIIAEGVPCNEIIVTTDNGKIESQQNCQYVFVPKEVGIASIFISKIVESDTLLLSEKKYRIKSWPLPEARIGRINSGEMGIAEFKAQRGIYVPILDFDISGQFQLNSYRMQIIRNRELLGVANNEGAAFDEPARKLVAIVQKKDRVIFDKIMVVMPGTTMETELEQIVVDIK